ncbi:MAG: hypothetical protein JOY61_15270, partial [Chloroflexi bacterium]|nr:hypothetical protein [Chloroflexota bacterium]
YEPYVPNKVVACLAPGQPATLPLHEGREPRNGQATAYVCTNYVCAAPTSDPNELRAQLR